MEKVKVDIGCGNNKKKGFIGIDVMLSSDADIVSDIGKYGIPLKSNSVDEIFSFHFLEHIENTLFIIEEMYRVLKPNGIVELVVPHFSNVDSYHWMHKTYWNIRGFNVFEKSGHHHYCFDVNFKILVRNIEFSQKRAYKSTVLEKIITKGSAIYEKWLCNLYRIYQIRVIMEKKLL
ncbi:methyltransferase domain-containing protein [Chloroflexota bacterium]